MRAAVEALLALRHLAGERLEINLVAPTPDLVLPAAHRPRALRAWQRAATALGGIVREQGAGHVFDGIAEIDPERRRVRAGGGTEHDYEALVVATDARAAEAVRGRADLP